MGQSFWVRLFVNTVGIIEDQIRRCKSQEEENVKRRVTNSFDSTGIAFGFIINHLFAVVSMMVLITDVFANISGTNMFMNVPAVSAW
jgi:hypothetical protein